MEELLSLLVYTCFLKIFMLFKNILKYYIYIYIKIKKTLKIY